MSNTTPTISAHNFNACIKHQDAEVYGKYGQRGCEDCVFTSKLVADFAEHITPEKIDNLQSAREHIDDPEWATVYALNCGHNACVDEITKRIKEYLK